MGILRMGARLLSRRSPGMLIASGAALALASPAIRHGLRAVLVTATKGALIITDKVSDLTEKIRAETAEIVEEARQTSGHCAAPIKSLRSRARIKGRRVAVATTAGVLGIQEKAKSVRDEFKGIVEEARQLQAEGKADELAEIPQMDDHSDRQGDIQPDGLEASTTDIGPDSSRKRRTGAAKFRE